eukprot:TRINITY_DN6217_c0_g1_i1.p2 TRINITY_DN6217_c0_g1~~TRINITY_DN6217_c0_g1_i1.p2  ORF type:complete len:158 (+),score=13.28 TRINITY_DN6217_c0_g1_i1:482-955(+)
MQINTSPPLSNPTTLPPSTLLSLKLRETPLFPPSLTHTSTQTIVSATPIHTVHQSRTSLHPLILPVKSAEKRPRSSSLSSLPHILKSPQTQADSAFKQLLITSSLSHRSSNPSVETSFPNTIASQEVPPQNSGSEISNCLFQLSNVDYAGFVKNFSP